MIKKIFYLLVCILAGIHTTTFAAPPEPAQHLTAVAGHETVYLYWAYPPSNNILGYITSISTDGGNKYKDERNIIAPEGGQLNTFFTVEELTNNQEYIFQIIAYNENLEQSIATISNRVVPTSGKTDQTPPENITNIEVIPDNKSVQIKWNPSANTSGDLIGYIIEKSIDNGHTLISDQFIGNTNSYTLHQLENDIDYTFTIKSKDAFGNISDGISINAIPRLEIIEDKNIEISQEIFHTPTFPDVTTGPFKEYIEYLEAKNIISGYSDGLFRPQKSLSRGEAVTLIIKSSDLELDTNIVVQSFHDIDEDHGLGVFIENAFSYSIINGYEDGSFQPDKAISRAEFIKIFVEILSTKLRTSISRFCSI